MQFNPKMEMQKKLGMDFVSLYTPTVVNEIKNILESSLVQDGIKLSEKGVKIGVTKGIFNIKIGLSKKNIFKTSMLEAEIIIGNQSNSIEVKSESYEGNDALKEKIKPLIKNLISELKKFIENKFKEKPLQIQIQGESLEIGFEKMFEEKPLYDGKTWNLKSKSKDGSEVTLQDSQGELKKVKAEQVVILLPEDRFKMPEHIKNNDLEKRRWEELHKVPLEKIPFYFRPLLVGFGPVPMYPNQWDDLEKYVVEESSDTADRTTFMRGLSDNYFINERKELEELHKGKTLPYDEDSIWGTLVFKTLTYFGKAKKAGLIKQSLEEFLQDTHKEINQKFDDEARSNTKL